MPYTPIEMPKDIEPELEGLIRGAVDTYLFDVHRLLAYADPDSGANNQLQYSAAMVLLAVVSGASSVLYAKHQNEAGKQFRGVLADFFPWPLIQLNGVSERGAIHILYDVFRNPLSHRFGLRPEGKTVKIGKIFRGSGESKEQVTRLELGDDPPEVPLIAKTDSKTVLWLDTLYFGVRKMIEVMLADKAVRQNAVDWIRSGKFEG